MKERPILFSAPMVRAILHGTKTQTRRVVKFKPWHQIEERDDGTQWPWMHNNDRDADHWVPCPYGKPGDRLWVRETWRIGAWSEDSGSIAIDYQADGNNRREWLEVPDGDDFLRYWQQSTDDAIKFFGDQDKYKWEPGQSPCRWRPSIHMPRFASRITLEITGVRVERLQDISKADSVAEGIERITSGLAKGGWYRGPLRGDSASIAQQAGHDSKIPTAHPGLAYQALWESINGPESWDANPWVWVVEFQPIDAATSAAVSR